MLILLSLQTSIYQMVCARNNPGPKLYPANQEKLGLTEWVTAQVMKDEAGRPFIIVREYVETL